MRLHKGIPIGDFIFGYDPVKRAWIIGPKTEWGMIDCSKSFGAYGSAEEAEEALKRIISGGMK